MDTFCKTALRKERIHIIQDLDPTSVIDYLYSESILTDADYNELDKKSKDDKTRSLLDILPKRGPHAFEQFVKALKADHSWLAEQLQQCYLSLPKDDSIVRRNQLKLGNVPNPPCCYVPRDELAKKIKELFCQCDYAWVVIQGMAGIGKSVLAADVAQKIDMFDYIHWIDLGSDMDDELLLRKMQTLCEKLDSSYRTSFAYSIEVARDRLRSLFGNVDNEKSLIVLNNAWRSEDVIAFNVGCAVLITTRDETVIKPKNEHLPKCTIERLEDGLSLDESLELLAQHVSLEVDALPSEAESICRLTKGVPLTLASVGGQLADYSLDREHWKSMLYSLQRRRRSSSSAAKILETLNETIGESVKHLDKDLQHSYQYFAIFRDGVSISREVLATLWDCSIVDVEFKLMQLCKKSLVTKIYNEDLETNEYSIHSLHHQYLQKAYECKLKDLHRELIERYKRACNSQWENLTDDNYIHMFIGYHLRQAGLDDELCSLYFNLEFAIAKLQVCGQYDLLIDYQKYSNILGKKDSKSHIDFVHFIKCNFHRLSDSDYDVIQLALAQPKSSIVYKLALNIAERTEVLKLYLDWRNSDGQQLDIIQINANEEIITAGFLPGGRKIIACARSGTIMVWDHNSGKPVYSSKIHGNPILCCDISYNGCCMVTCAEGEPIKLWSVKAKQLEKLNGIDSSDSSDDSPEVFKINHNPYDLIHSADVTVTSLSDFNSVTACALSVDGKTVMAGNSEGLIKCWSVEKGEEMFSIRAHEGEVTLCQFSPDQPLFVTSSTTDGSVKLWNMRSLTEPLKEKKTQTTISSCCFFPCGRKLAFNEGTKVILWQLDELAQESCFEDPDKAQISSIAVSGDGKRVAAGTPLSTLIWSATDCKLISSHSEHKDWIKHVNFSQDGNFLLSVSVDNQIIVWKCDAKEQSNETKHASIYCSRFTGCSVKVSIANDSHEQLWLLNYNSTKSKESIVFCSSQNKITACSLSVDGNTIAVGYQNGKIDVLQLIDHKWSAILPHQSAYGCVTRCMFTSSNQLVCGFEDGTIVIFWKFTTNDFTTCCGHTKAIKHLKLLNAKNFFSASEDGKIICWNIADGTKKFECLGHNESILACQVSNKQLFLLTGSADKTAKLWSASKGKLLIVYENKDCVRSCCFSMDDAHIFTGDDSGYVKMWNLKENVSLKSWFIGKDWVHGMQLSSENLLVTACDVLKWWDTKPTVPKLVQTFPIKGRRALFVEASSDFQYFTAIDDAGYLYILHVVQCPEEPSR